MGRYELVFEVDHLDDDLIDAIYDRFDALVAAHDDITLLTITAQGPTVIQAAKSVAAKLQGDLQIVTRRLAGDLVTQEVIAGGCVTGKRCYLTAASAGDALLSARITATLHDTCHHRREQRCYACPHCGYWHLTSRPGQPLSSRQRHNQRRTRAWLTRRK